MEIPSAGDSSRGDRIGWRDLLPAALVVIALPLLLSVFYVGFQASDDIQYLNGAAGWLEHFPYVGDNHWTLRHTITLPTALAVYSLGLSRLTAGLPALLYFVAFLGVNLWGIRRWFGPTATLIAMAGFLTLPGFLVVATYLNPDIPELFFVSTAFWLFLWARERPQAADDPSPSAGRDERRHEATAAHEATPSQGRWWLAGLVAGVGFVNRQTAAAFALFVIGVWLFAPGVIRQRYLLMGLGFVAVVCADWLYLTVVTGHPDYRFNVDFHHDPVNRSAEVARVAAGGGWIDKEGNLSLSVWADPVLNLLVSQKYTLVFWLLMPAAFAMWRHRQTPGATARCLLLALGAASFLFVALNPKLYLVPRYFLTTAWAAVVLVSWWLALRWKEGRRGWVSGLLAVWMVANAAALSVENVDPRRPERELVDWVTRHPGERIHTDIETLARAGYFFQFAGLDARQVSTDAPPAGARFFYSADRVAQCTAMPRCRQRAGDFQPGPGWYLERAVDGPLRPGARLASIVGLERWLPSDVARRVFKPVGSIAIYRVGTRPSDQ